MQSLFNAFRDLRSRLAVVMEALKVRMEVRMVDPADVLSGHTLLDRLEVGETAAHSGRVALSPALSRSS